MLLGSFKDESMFCEDGRPRYVWRNDRDEIWEFVKASARGGCFRTLCASSWIAGALSRFQFAEWEVATTETFSRVNFFINTI